MNLVVPGGPSWRGANALYVCRKLGLTSGLQLCLDAGDAASYTSGQSWLDLSGNGYDFFLGDDGTAEAEDPTFTGTAGRLSSGEYFDVDSGDIFTYDTTNETWMNNLHKDSTLWGAACWMMCNATSVNRVFSTSLGSTQIGVLWFVNTSNGFMNLQVTNGAAFCRNDGASVGTVSGVWQFYGITIDEAADTCTYIGNSTTNARSGAFTSPSASNATNTMTLHHTNKPDRMAMLVVWQGVAPSVAQLSSFYQATRGRFGV